MGEEARRTYPHPQQALGNELFTSAVAAIAFDDTLSREILTRALKLFGASPQSVEIYDLADALPEVERRMRLLATPDRTDPALRRLRTLIFDWFATKT